MPAAAPLPRGPTVITLYNAADLLTAPGCPVCHYATEAADRYLGWFALEGHAEPAMITALCASLGMCARHTRRLMSQPGAAARLTAVYRYVLIAARELIASRDSGVRPCPACQRAAIANRSALETLLDGLSEAEVRGRCRELGGVCLPHLSAALACGPRRVAAWLADTLQETLATSSAAPGWLAGTDPDVEGRTVLRRALPPGGTPAACTCTVCLAMALAERDGPSVVLAHPVDDSDPVLMLCDTHLADAAFTAPAPHQLRALLARQAAWLVAPPSHRRWPRRTAGCVVCRTAGVAGNDALADVLRTATQAQRHRNLICARHYLVVRAADKRAGLTLAPVLSDVADSLVSELTSPADQSAPARRHLATMPDSAAWQRAAAFLDAAVFGGLLPPH